MNLVTSFEDYTVVSCKLDISQHMFGYMDQLLVRTIVYLKKFTCAFRVNFIFFNENARLDI